MQDEYSGWEPVSGDNGPNLFGHAWGTATYVVQHPEFGWLAFGGNLKSDEQTIRITPLDSSRTRIYIAPYGLWLTLNAGTFREIVLDLKTSSLRVGLSAANRFTREGRLHIEQPAKVEGVGSFAPPAQFKLERGDYVVPLSTRETWIEICSK